MKRYALPCIGLIIILCICIQGVSAVSVDIGPEQINEGDTITISIVDLPDESNFTLQMFSTTEVHESALIAFQTNQITIPFGLKDASAHINVSPVSSGGIEETNNGKYNSIEWTAESGIVSKNLYIGNTSSGTIDLIRVFGTPIEGAKFVNLNLDLSGTKTGSESGDITFGFEGLSEGGVTINVLVDSAEVAHQPIIIVEPDPLPEHSVYIGDTAVSISYLIYSPQEAQELVNQLISRQNLHLADLWYQITGEPVKNIKTLNEASEDDLNQLKMELCTYINKNGEEEPIDC